MTANMSRLILCLGVSFALVASMIPMPTHAGIVSSGDALSVEQGKALETVESYLRQDEVAQELQARGVDPEVALARAQALSPEELDAMAERIDELPAGSIGVIEVLGVTFLVLLVLHLTGVIQIFR